jgi:hypothetical protein
MRITGRKWQVKWIPVFTGMTQSLCHPLFNTQCMFLSANSVENGADVDICRPPIHVENEVDVDSPLASCSPIYHPPSIVIPAQAGIQNKEHWVSHHLRWIFRSPHPKGWATSRLISWIIGTLVLFTSPPVLAQNEPDTVESLKGIEIETSVDRAEVYIGDLITYQLTVIHDSTIELEPPPLGANLGAFDVKDYQSDIRSKLPDGRIKSTNKFVLSTFTTGDYVIPPIPVMFIMPDSSRKVILSQAVPIKINSLLSAGADSADIRPLKAQYEFKRDLGPYYFWGGLVLLILVISAILIWLRLRKKRRATEPLDLRAAWEIAFERLALLKQQDLVAESKYKQYYVELTEIARQYLGRMHDINALDMTTEEFLLLFKERELPSGLHEDISRFLRHADLVKFAKFIPERERTESDFEYVHEMIEQVRVDFERQQATMVSTDSHKSEQDAVSDIVEGTPK